MDAKVTLSFDEQVIAKAKAYAETQGISLSRLTEFLLRKITENHSQYKTLEDFPISDWVNMAAEGEISYKTKNQSINKKEYYDSRK